MSEVQQNTTDLDILYIMQTENTYWEPGHISDLPIEVMLKTSCRLNSSQIPGPLVSEKSGKRVVQCFIMYLVFKIFHFIKFQIRGPILPPLDQGILSGEPPQTQ